MTAVPNRAAAPVVVGIAGDDRRSDAGALRSLFRAIQTTRRSATPGWGRALCSVTTRRRN